MFKLLKVTLLLSLFSLVIGCNPAGTCKIASDSPDLGDSCIVNYNKRPCESMQGAFFKEDSTAGLVRCKGEGYEATGMPPGDVTRKLKAGESVTLFKKK